MFYRTAVAGFTLSVCAFEGLSRREMHEVTSSVALPLASPEPWKASDAAAKNEWKLFCFFYRQQYRLSLQSVEQLIRLLLEKITSFKTVNERKMAAVENM